MKSTQLLSVVFSLIMFTGVSAGGVAFADEDLEDRLEFFCEMSSDEQREFFSDYPELAEYDERLAAICDIDDENERYDSLEEIIDEVVLETKDEEDDYDDFDEEYDELDEEVREMDEEQERDYDDYLEDRLAHFCDMSDEDKRQFFDEHPRIAQFSDRLTNYCNMSDDERDDAIDRFIDENEDDFRVHHDMRKHLDRYCGMTDEDKRNYVAEHDKAQDHVEKMNRYCSLGEDGRMDFIEEHRDEYKAHMKEKMHDKMKYKMHDKMTDKKHHMNYDRLCAMAESDRAAEITDLAKLDRISKWCDMTPDEREDYKKKHHADMKDKMHDKITDRKHDMRMDAMHDKMSDKSKRLKAMIMAKYDISDERLDEIKMKYQKKYGDMSDERKSELKMKFKNHMKFMKHHMTDERKAEIHDRISEMRDFKAELRERASDMTDEEKQQLREEFIEKAKDLQLAWITPRTQIAAGIDAAEVECREGFTLVMKSSNGVPMCLKADTALRMIDRGIVVPAN